MESIGAKSSGVTRERRIKKRRSIKIESVKSERGVKQNQEIVAFTSSVRRSVCVMTVDGKSAHRCDAEQRNYWKLKSIQTKLGNCLLIRWKWNKLAHKMRRQQNEAGALIDACIAQKFLCILGPKHTHTHIRQHNLFRFSNRSNDYRIIHIVHTSSYYISKYAIHTHTLSHADIVHIPIL